MHKKLEQQVRLSIRDGKLNPDILVRLVDSSYREGDSRTHTLLDRLDDAVLVLNEENTIIDVNPAARKLLAIPQGPLDVLKLDQFIPDLVIDESLQHAQGAVLAEQKNVAGRTLSASSISCDVNLFVLKTGENGKRLCVLRTAAAAVKPETTKAQATDASEVFEAQEKYLAMMSHELRTPMNAVLGMAKHLAETDMTEDQLENVKTIIDAGDVMMSLLNDLLDKSKLDAGKFSLENTNVDLRHMLQKMVRLWRPTIEAQGLAFSLEIGDEVISAIRGDSVRIRQILSNLLSNAAKFTNSGSVILSVHAKPLADGKVEVDFSVRDTGIGMSEEVQKNLFNAYVQANSSTSREYGGTGLGLSISRQLAQMMGGDLVVESKENLGSIFHFIASFETSSKSQNQEAKDVDNVPKAQVTERAIAPLVAKPAAAPKPTDDSLRILAVEDNPINQRVLAAFLRPIGGEVVWAGHGQEALELLADSYFDVVLMDIQMPVMDGLTAAKTLRDSDSINVDVPIIAMTANAMLGDRETCLAAGMNDYVSKPIDPKTLYKSISKLVDEYRAVKQTSQQVCG
ncbi:MAG: ATP-binding protein [Robiginitomaculum sp.]|nr:ATP-binding protein [Robiginitomaculum sp.]